MELPCGTASLARQRPVAQFLVAQGSPKFPPLRLVSHPLLVPNFSDFHQAKVTSANKLSALTVEILVFCARRGIAVSVENLADSWVWVALIQLTLQHSEEASRAYNNLEKVVFHVCVLSWLNTKENDGWEPYMSTRI